MLCIQSKRVYSMIKKSRVNFVKIAISSYVVLNFAVTGKQMTLYMQQSPQSFNALAWMLLNAYKDKINTQ